MLLFIKKNKNIFTGPTKVSFTKSSNQEFIGEDCQRRCRLFQQMILWNESYMKTLKMPKNSEIEEDANKSEATDEDGMMR